MTKETSLNYFNGNELADSVWKSKYALKHEGKQIEETPHEMHLRMAKEFARIEQNYGKNALSEGAINNLFYRFGQVIPQGSVMAVLGNPHQIASLSNCIVLPKLYDSYGGIMYADQQLAQLMKRRCGVGLDISTLRPAGTAVSNAAQTSTGATSFMNRFSNTTREVAQDGRRGALMISMHINHPEAEQFALIKQDLTKITGANISLKITDEFMQCVEAKGGFAHRFPVESNNVVRTVPAQNLWNTIVSCAHNTAEPGLIFWDRQHKYSPSSIYPEFENISTNPCSEIAMGNDSCRLIAKNMFSCVKHPFTENAYFDFTKWYTLSYETMRLMDDLVDLELEAIAKILSKIGKDDEPQHIKSIEVQTWVQLSIVGARGRRTGAGLTALGDVLAALGLKYDSTEAIETVEQIMLTKLAGDLDSTIDMAEERGAFPAFDAALEARYAEQEDTFFYMIKNTFPQKWERMQKVGRRNISWSTVAPNGSLSLLAKLDGNHYGSTSGIEPLFKVYYIRRKKINPNDKDTRVDYIDALGDKWQEFKVFHEGFKMWYEINYPEGFKLESLPKEQLDILISQSPYAGCTAEEIDWKGRIQMQAVIQKYITHSISSTINLPTTATTDEVSAIYFAAWRQGLKGITIYREGSRSGVLVSEPTKKQEILEYHDAPKRPKELEADFHTVRAKGESYCIIIGLLNSKPYEVFAFNAAGLESTKGKVIKVAKGRYKYESEDFTLGNLQKMALHTDEMVLTRLISGMMRHGVNPKFIIEQIDKCPLEIVSFGKALARVIKKYIPEKELNERAKCTSCGSTNVRYEEGCAKCLDCGGSKCS